MESNKLDVEAAVLRSDADQLKSTYKALPEQDILDKDPELGSVKSKMVKENGEACPDGADEKMLAAKDGPEVKFISADSQHNGDAKIDIENVKQVFTGMTKDELMKYANDPFWVRLRWVMFILFWLLWAAMLAGAIAIIIGAPKCAAPEPKTWWEKGPLVEIELANAEKGLLTSASAQGLGHFDNQSLLASDFEKLRTLGVRSVVLAIPDDFDIYHQKYDAIEKIVKDAKANEIDIILGVQANFVPKSSPYFLNSEKAEAKYKDYFIWAVGKVGEPPTNWNAIVNGSAWTKSSIRENMYYLHQYGTEKPDLNFNIQEVADLFKSAIERWAGFGVLGVRLTHAKHLLVDQMFMNEAYSNTPGFIHTDYGYLNHLRTSNQDGLADLVKQWKRAILNATKEEGVLYIKEEIDSKSAFRINDTLLVPNLPGDSKTLRELSKPDPSARVLFNSLSHISKLKDWPHWQYSSGSESQISEHNIVVMLLPGVPELTPAQLFNSNPNSTLFKINKELIELRKLASVQYGAFSAHLLANETVLTYTREWLKSGNPGLLCLYNPGWVSVIVNLETVPSIPPEVTVYLLSENYEAPGVQIRSKLFSNNVQMPQRSALVLSYVPKSED